jgi:hypothetical protein
MNVGPSTFADRSIYREKYGDPRDWEGDFRAKVGRYHGIRQAAVSALLEGQAEFIVALAVRGFRSNEIAALFGVSRESVDRRLRPLGLKNPPGQVGRPARRRVAFVAAKAPSLDARDR